MKRPLASRRGYIEPAGDQARLPARAELAKVTPGAHGGTKSSELVALGFTEGEVIDFSASVSPFGPSPLALEALSAVRPEAYPDPGAPRLTAAIARSASVSDSSVIVTNGSVELLQLVTLAYLGPEVRLLTLSPYFGEYAPAAQIAGARFESFRLTPAFSLDREGFVEWVARRLPAAVILNDPHNPSGLAFGEGLVEELLELDGELLLVVDEAYRDFQERPCDLTTHLESGRLLLMRSLTKAHALAGLRLGYGISTSEIVGELRTVQPPWTVNAYAQAAGIAALADRGRLDRTMSELRSEKAFLVEGLRRLGLSPAPSAANFFLVEVGDELGGAAALRQRLLARRLRVRSCDSFGLPNYLRIAPRIRSDNALLLAILEELLCS